MQQLLLSSSLLLILVIFWLLNIVVLQRCWYISRLCCIGRIWTFSIWMQVHFRQRVQVSKISLRKKYGEHIWTKNISNESWGLVMNFTSFIFAFAPTYFKSIVGCRKSSRNTFNEHSDSNLCYGPLLFTKCTTLLAQLSFLLKCLLSKFHLSY